jgi:hypothetical protein
MLAGWLALGCAAAPPPSPAAPAEETKVAAPQKQLEYSSQIGGLDQDAVSARFAAMQRDVQRCLEDGLGRLDALGGEFTVALVIKLDGSVRDAFMKASTLGDRETERCVLAAARGRSWPRPLSGEGKAEHTYSADAMVDVRAIDGKRIERARTSIMKQLYKCLSGKRGRWSATVYLRWDGAVVSAGVAPPNAAAEEKSDCVVDVLETFNFGRQRARMSKVTFAVGW